MSPWTEFVKMHINKCPGATPQARMRSCAEMYRKRRHGGGKRAGSVFHVGRQGSLVDYAKDAQAKSERLYPLKDRKTPNVGIKMGKGVRSIMPARQGVGLHVGAGARKRRPRSQQALAAAIHGLMAHGRRR